MSEISELKCWAGSSAAMGDTGHSDSYKSSLDLDDSILRLRLEAILLLR